VGLEDNRQPILTDLLRTGKRSNFAIIPALPSPV